MDSRTNNRGFTLIEVMLALTLGALVIGVSTTVAIQSVAVRRSVAAEIDARWERANLLDQFEQDVHSIVTWVPKAEKNVSFADDESILFTMLALEDANDPGTLMRRRLPARVSYYLKQDADNSPVKQLMRRSQPLVDGFSIVEEVIATGVAEVHIEAFDGEEWSEKRMEKSAGALPLALRLRCAWKNDGSVQAVRTAIVHADHKVGNERRHK